MTDRLRAVVQRVSALGYIPVYASLYGSQNYGLALDEDGYHSDYDFKCIVLPSLRDLVEEKKPASLTIDTADGQIDIKDIRVFADVVIKMNPAYLECLAADHSLILPGGKDMERMCALLPELMTQRMAVFARVCCGLFEEKAKKMRHPYPTVAEKIERFGYDGKQVHHMYRLLVTLRAFEESGRFQLIVPEGEKPLLTALKLNRIALDEAERMIETWREEMHVLREHIAQRYPVRGNQAAEEIARISREMVYAHCVDEAKKA